MTRRRPTGASVLLAAAALLVGVLAPSAAVAAPEDSEGVGVRVDITPLEEPTTEEPTTEEPTTEEPTTEDPSGGEQPTDAEPTGTGSPTPGSPSPTDTSTPGGDLPDTGVDLATALWITGPLLAAGAALALLAARRRGMTTGR
ncbi:hypothetical protein V2J56_14375 [Georgenia sp. MJ206]|uniref:hypothetical protein n=1 Tax=Georgenia wangjunii TaxID=3117730 RepID=UPI002F26C277